MKINRFRQINEELDEETPERPGETPKTTDNKKKKTPALDAFGTNLSELAEEGKLDPVVGRKDEVLQASWILCRKKKNNPVLIGEPGTGKTAIVEGLAQLIHEKKCPIALRGKIIYSVEMGSLIAGASQKGQFEERVQAIVKELEKNPEIILFIDEVHMICGGGGDGIDFANMLKPALARGKVQIIGATTLNEFRQSIEKDGALERRFQKVMVEETTPEQTLEILNNIKKSYEDYHKVTYTDEALKACVDLANKHIPDRFFPDKAIDLLDEVGAKAHLNDIEDATPVAVLELEKELEEIQKKKGDAVSHQRFPEAAELRVEENKTIVKLTDAKKAWEDASVDLPKISISARDVADVFSVKTGIPTDKFTEEEGSKLLTMATSLKMDVIGQDEAINKVSKCIKRNRAGLKDPKKPLGVFLFLGKTGTGKTQLVKSLAKNLFGSEDNMVRFDMSEFHEKHNVARLIGSPPGYVGYDQGGQLTEKVRRKPYCVILLDEIEKSHPDVRDIFLQVFDDGQLTDGQGRKVSFKNTIIIMTSNIGATKVKEMIPHVGFKTGGESQVAIRKEEEEKDVMKKELAKSLTPEFLNRIDDVIVFSSLSKESIYKIIDIEMRNLASRVKGLGFTLNISDAAKDFIIEMGYDEKMGARPLKRAIQRYVEDPLADEILKKTIKDVVNIDYNPTTGILINNNPIEERVRITKFGDFKKNNKN